MGKGTSTSQKNPTKRVTSADLATSFLELQLRDASPASQIELDNFQTLLEVGSRLRTTNMARATHRVVYETIIYPAINAMEIMILKMTADAPKKAIADALAEMLNSGLDAEIFDKLMENMMELLVQSLTGDIVDTVQKKIVQHISPRLRKELKFTASQSVSRDVGRALTLSITSALSDTLSRTLSRVLENDLTRTVTRHVNGAIVPEVTMGAVPSIVRAVKRDRVDDLNCYYCQEAAEEVHKKVYCGMCQNDQARDAAEDYFNYYNARYFSRYYAYFYGGYFADQEAHQYLDEKQQLTLEAV